MTSRKRLLVCAAFGLVVLVWVIPFLAQSLGKATQLESGLWSSESAIVESAICARETGRLLVICGPGNKSFIPLSEVDRADDPGHALLVGVSSLVSQKYATPQAISTVNTAVNFAGIVLLAIFLFVRTYTVAAFGILILLTPAALNLHAIGPHPSHLGVACLAALLPVALIGVNRPQFWSRWNSVLVSFGMVGGALAMLLRQPFGYASAMMAIAVVAFQLLTGDQRRATRMIRIRNSSLGVVAAVGTVFLPAILLVFRNFLYGLTSSPMNENHGIWHSIVAGLGTVPNPWGLEWNDGVISDVVSSRAPEVGYTSPAYFAELRTFYFEILLADPDQVLAIYWQKLILTLNSVIAYVPFRGLSLAAVLVLVTVLIVLSRVLYSSLGILGHAGSGARQQRKADPLVVVAASFVLFFIMQAVVVTWFNAYLYPVIVPSVILLMCALEYLRPGPEFDPVVQSRGTKEFTASVDGIR